MPRLSFRPATRDDHQWLFGLHEAAHRDLVERAYGPWEEHQQRAFFRPLVEDHDVFVISEAGTPVGAVYLRVENGDTWVELIEVSPERQGQGLGSEALASVVQCATRATAAPCYRSTKPTAGLENSMRALVSCA